MDKVDKKIEEIKALQAELDRRTRVEKEALELIGQCRFEEAKKLLSSLDDKKVLEEKKMVYNGDHCPKSEETESPENEPYKKPERYAVEARIFNTGKIITKIRPPKGWEGTGVLEGKLYCRCVDVFDSREEAEEFCKQYYEPWEGKEKHDYEGD